MTTGTDRLLGLFSEGLGVDVESLDEDTSPDNTAQWDSLAAMEMVTLIEGAFGVRLSARDIMKMQTIGLARQVLQGKDVTGI
ncbi:MAG: acyl carrier protein [Ilumatobacter sp.]|jgi:acyl carrier protein